MKKYVNGEYVEMTPEEIEELQEQQKKWEDEEKHRPLREDEVLNMFLTQNIQILAVDDNTALRMISFYPVWEDLCESSYNAKDKGFKFSYGDKLYKTIQDNFTFQSQWIPGEGTSAIYTRIDELHTGLIDDPIPVPEDVTTNAFTYKIGLYYTYNGTLYLCQGTGDELGKENSFVYSPDQLIGNYFTKVEQES